MDDGLFMNTIDPKLIRVQVNKCFDAYYPGEHTQYVSMVRAFKYHLELSAGLKVDFVPLNINAAFKNDGRYGYQLNSAEIVDETLFTVFMLKWT